MPCTPARARLLLAAVLAPAALASAQSSIVTLTAPGTQGGWNWCMDERAIVDGNKLITGWMTTDGRVQTTAYDFRAGASGPTFNLDTNFEIDDHNNPSFYKTSDGRYTAFYSEHTWPERFVHYRTSTNPGDVSAWGAKTDIQTNTLTANKNWGVTYPHAYQVPGGTRDEAMLLWRGGNWKPTFSTGTYSPATQTWSWSQAKNYIVDFTDPANVNTNVRPYTQVTGNARQLGVIVTDHHPRDASPGNKLYYVSIKRDAQGDLAYVRADGTVIQKMSAGALHKSQAEKIYVQNDGNAGNGDNVWGWDVQFDAHDRPVVAYASFVPDAANPSNQRLDTHQYHYTRWNGSQWVDRLLVADAGGSIARLGIGNDEMHYSGGIAIDPVDPNIVYLSQKVDGQFELQQWKTNDFGLTWAIKTITSSPNAEDVRPVVPLDRPADVEMVLWMSGQYEYWKPWSLEGTMKSFNTSVMLWTNVVPEPGCVAALAVALVPLGRPRRCRDHRA